jgi:hypothetical protein
MPQKYMWLATPADRSGKAYLELLQIALAALTAAPEACNQQ